ncbi:hypothetical protein HDU76_011133, partial [Blyttiomyces sp. JEL0837]
MATAVPLATLKRFLTLFTTCIAMATAGSLFSFSVISESLKSKLSFSSADINVVSGVGNAALYVMFLAVGPLFDFAGAQFTMLFAAVTYAIGYLLMYLAFNGTIIGNVGAISFFYFLAGTGSTAA